ncbi:MAG: dihydroorotate dehydrogenase-like protein [Spirochaetaceae bacterium]|nr:dihydroorotate dehydrogenase-like protein [Spirochaetaceae bacterium]MDT8297759.1 dihydroorotate dehydrogenase-like protein [Spirochaetaceae bacterium]
MANLKTDYMGIALENPVIAGASELTSNMDSIKRIEDAGAGAMVIKSLFEEQIQLERARFDEEQHKYDNIHAEMTSLYPDMEHSGPEEHLTWVRKAKEACSMPVIASLNAVNKETWVEWAKKLEETGVDGLELNFFANPELQEGDGASIEKDQIAVVKDVAKAVKIPVSIKMSLFYTAPLSVAKAFDKSGAKGLVMFNKFFQPDIDAEKEKSTIPLNLSVATAGRLPLRYSGLLFGEVGASICASSGIMDGLDAAKMILAGADVVQVVSTLYRNKITQIGRIVGDLEKWMDGKGYASLADFRGKMSRKNTTDPWTYKRAQYARLLMKPDPMKIVR